MDTTALAERLLPCPFCGGEAFPSPPTAKPSDPIERGGRFFPVVRCGCGVESAGRDHDTSCKSAIEKWNRRATPATVTDEDVDRALDVYCLGGAVRSETDRKRDMRAALESFANKEPTDE